MNEDDLEAIENLESMSLDLRSQAAAWMNEKGLQNDPLWQGCMAHLDSLAVKFGKLVGREVLK